jgi:hypothetical protein
MTSDIAVRREVIYRFAFKHLLSLPNVYSYVSDFELQKIYAHLLGLPPSRLPFYPCNLIPTARQTIPGLVTSVEKTVTILYFGDAKPEKGFLELPAIVKAIDTRARDRQYVIHFTVPANNKSLELVADLIRELAIQADNILLLDRFVSNSELMYLFESSKEIILNYGDDYIAKSSGLLWLAAYFELNIGLNKATWLEREARRLGTSYFYMDSLLKRGQTPAYQLGGSEVEKCEPKEAGGIEKGYREQLFGSFDVWLNRVCKELWEKSE